MEAKAIKQKAKQSWSKLGLTEAEAATIESYL